MRLRVSYSPLAAEQFTKLKAAKPGTARASAYNGFKHFIEVIVSESDLALLPQHRLTGNLAGVLRLKKGRMRLFFIASAEKQAAIVLMLGSSLRKEGSQDDPYEEVRRYLKRDTFDACFAELGLTKPHA